MSFSYTVGGKSLTQQRGKKSTTSNQEPPKICGNRASRSVESQRTCTQSNTGRSPGGLRSKLPNANDSSSTSTFSSIARSTGRGRGGGRGPGTGGSNLHEQSNDRSRKEDLTSPKSSASNSQRLETKPDGNIVTLSDLKSNARTRSSSNSSQQNYKPHSKQGQGQGNVKKRSDVKSERTRLRISGGAGRKLGAPTGESRTLSAGERNSRSQLSCNNLQSERVNRTRSTAGPSTSNKINGQAAAPAVGASSIGEASQRGRGTRGRGLGRGQQQSGRMAYNKGLYASNAKPVGQRPGGAPQSQPPAPQQQQEQQQQEDAKLYSVISPKEAKRQQLLNKASKEQQALDDYRAAKKPTTITGPAQSTGGQKSVEEARIAMEREHRNKKYEQILKRKQYETEKREREDRKLNEMKARAREKAQQNKRRDEERARNFLQHDHARANEQFLQRLETGLNTNNSAQNDSGSHNSDVQTLQEIFPQKSTSQLLELLTLTKGDVQKVIDLLS